LATTWFTRACTDDAPRVLFDGLRPPGAISLGQPTLRAPRWESEAARAKGSASGPAGRRSLSVATSDGRRSSRCPRDPSRRTTATRASTRSGASRPQHARPLPVACASRQRLSRRYSVPAFRCTVTTFAKPATVALTASGPATELYSSADERHGRCCPPAPSARSGPEHAINAPGYVVTAAMAPVQARRQTGHGDPVLPGAGCPRPRHARRRLPSRAPPPVVGSSQEVLGDGDPAGDTGDGSAARARVVRDTGEARSCHTSSCFFDLTSSLRESRVSRTPSRARHRSCRAWRARFMAAFFAVWVAWMNFTWFASAHDSRRRDVPPPHAGAGWPASSCWPAGLTRRRRARQFSACDDRVRHHALGLVLAWLEWRETSQRARTACPAVRGWHDRAPDAVAPAADTPDALVVATSSARGGRAAGARLGRAGPRLDRCSTRPHRGPLRMLHLTCWVKSISRHDGVPDPLDKGGLAPTAGLGVEVLVLAFAIWWLYFDHPGHLAQLPTRRSAGPNGHVVISSRAPHRRRDLGGRRSRRGRRRQHVGALAVAIPRRTCSAWYW